MRSVWNRVLMATALAAVMQGAYAVEPAREFSAIAVQVAPDKEPLQARMFVGHECVRMEYDRGGDHVAEIVDWGRGRALLLMPDKRIYMERSAPTSASFGVQRQTVDSNPCLGQPDLECRKLGTEELYGRSVEKWEMVGTHEGKTYRSLHWIDPIRQVPLRQFWPDGSITELKPAGTTTADGRSVEIWDQITTRPDGQSMKTTQWYDPELRIAIREELPGGYYRELRNIRVAPQPAQLFEIPVGFQRMETPPVPTARENTAQPYPETRGPR